MRKFPHYKYIIMALFDTLYNLLSAFPTPHIGYARALSGSLVPWLLTLSSLS